MFHNYINGDKTTFLNFVKKKINYTKPFNDDDK